AQQEVKLVNDTNQPAAQQTVVKEMTSMQQSVVPAGETTGFSDSSSDTGSDRNGANQQTGSQTMAQPLFGQQKTEHQAAAVKATAEPVQQDTPGQIAQQVRERLGQHELKAGNQQISLTLKPENLGEVRMNLNLQGQKLTIEIVTENRTVRDAIMQHADSLKDSLAKQNITMESFDVTSNGRGSGNQGEANQNAWRELARQQQQQRFWTSLDGGNRNAQAEAVPGRPAAQTADGRSMLDIHY
ncbi:MAG TPA: flagellar hook-length control protein FliK, partial [Desulfuromonadales bacterium]|nr:flagellar hook-length control protein FliK [Desulfuromonadales bacterium]